MRRYWNLVGLLAAAPLGAQSIPNPHELIDSAISAMGGRAQLAGLAWVRLVAAQHEYMLGNAERAEGPWRVQYTKFSELWDVPNNQLRHVAALPAGPGPAPTQVEVVSIVTDSVLANQSGGRITPGYGGNYEAYRIRMDESPVRALLAAGSAPDLSWQGRVVRFGVPHDVVTYRTPSGVVRIEIDRYTHLPDAIEMVRHWVLDIRRSIFGDVTTRIENLDWNVQSGGIWWPMQQRILFNHEVATDISFSEVDLHAAGSVDSFVVADSTRAAFASARQRLLHFKLGSQPEPAQPGGNIIRLADNWAMTLVRQRDGVVIFEAHLGDEYIKQIVADVARRWPGSRIKAFVLTSDPWAHLGGLREVVAMGIPIYVQGASIPFLTRIAAAPFRLDPDDLARTPRAPHFIPVNGKTVIGAGDERIELYPVRGAYAERMLMAYFPRRRLLYGADLVFPDRAAPNSPAQPAFLPTPAIELRRAVAREGLQVDSVFSVQARYPVFAWKDFVPAGLAQ